MGGFCRPGTQTSTSTQQTSYAPYIEDMIKAQLERANLLSQQPYQAYTQPRIADFTQDQKNYFQKVRDMQGYGQEDMKAALDRMKNVSDYNPNTVTGAGATADQIGSGTVVGRDIDAERIGIRSLDPRSVSSRDVMARDVASRDFDSAAAQKYMDPFLENVLDRQRQRMYRADDIARQGRDAKAVGAGAFGGSRQAIVEAEAQKNLQDRIADQEGQAMSRAYQTGQQAFKSDADRALQAERANQQASLGADKFSSDAALKAALANQQTGFKGDLATMQSQLAADKSNQIANLEAQKVGASNEMKAQLANQQAQLKADLANQQQNLQAGMFSSGQDLKGQLANQQAGLSAAQMNTANQMKSAQGIAGLLGQGQGMMQNQLGMLSGIGGQQQGINQAGLDMMYQDYQNQQQYPYQQIGFLSNILQGTPMGQTTTMTGQTPTPSMGQQLAGLGITGLGIAGAGGYFSPGGFAMGNLFQ